jgi:4-alpha-glucanotransferase
VNEYPNWRIPLADGAGAPVLLEDLPAHQGVRAVAEAVRGGSHGGLAGGADRVHA